MATNRYSLADHIVTIKLSNSNASTNMASIIGVDGISIGGPGQNYDGSFVGTISVTRNKEVWSTKGDETGSWVHELNLDKTGTVQIDINQVSDHIVKLVQICYVYETDLSVNVGFTISVCGAGGEIVALCEDCYITKIPDQNYAASTEQQRWQFTCGRVNFFPNSNKNK